MGRSPSASRGRATSHPVGPAGSVCVRACVCIYIYIYIYIHIHIHTCMYIYIYIYVHMLFVFTFLGQMSWGVALCAGGSHPLKISSRSGPDNTNAGSQYAKRSLCPVRALALWARLGVYIHIYIYIYIYVCNYI